MRYVLSFDIGTTGVKTCIYSVGDIISLVDSESMGYGLTVFENGGVEQDEREWWNAIKTTTRTLIERNRDLKEKIEAISTCSQMQALVLVDESLNPVHHPMSYMDQRASSVQKKYLKGGIEIAGANVFKLLKCIKANRAAPLSVKDPIWKYLWIKENEKENYEKASCWLDVKDYINAKMTGNYTMSEDSAFATLMYDTKKREWSKELLKMFSVKPSHMPKIIKSTDIVGRLTEEAANDLNLKEGVIVFSGGGDASVIAVGAGSSGLEETHIYWGTSGWVVTILDKQLLDVSHMVASTVGVESGRYNYFAEMETAGKSLEWVRDHLALDEIGIYLEKKNVTEILDAVYKSLYDYLSDTIKKIPAGSNGVIFTPYLHGNRCPFEDPNASAMFFNICLETGKGDLIRSVVEGVCFHLKWMLDVQNEKVKIKDSIRFVGGGALSDETCQILADITGKIVEVPADAQNAGALGAAAIAALGLGEIKNFSDLKKFIPLSKTYYPDNSKKAVYDKNYKVFKELYKANKKLMRDLNRSRT